MLDLLSPEESEHLMGIYWSKVPVSYRYVMAMTDGKDILPAFVFENSALVLDEDGGVTWHAREIGIGLHSFIELKTGQGVLQRTIYLPLCLVNSKSRKVLEPLIHTTISPADGRLNSRKAEFFVMRGDGRGAKIKVSLPSLATHYALLRLFPPDFPIRMRSKSCIFCRNIEEAVG
jgi:hypothetical protein